MTELVEQSALSAIDLSDARADAQRAGLRHIEDLIYVDSLYDVAESFGDVMTDGVDRDRRLAYITGLATRHLDFRQGKSRADAIKPQLSDWQLTALTKLGDELGMMGVSNAFETPADIFIVHGTYASGINERLLWAGQHLDVQANARPDVQPIVVGATNDRLLVDKDKERPLTLAPYAQTERHVMDDGFEKVLGGRLQRGSDDTNIRRYTLPAGAEGVTFSAVKIEGREHANTADTHMHAATVLGSQALLGAEVVGVTAQVYVPFQKGDLLRTLGLEYGARIRMAGYRDPAITEPHHIGQEYRAAINQAVKLQQAILTQRANKGDEV